MSKTKVVPLKLGTGARPRGLPFSCEVERSKRKTLAIHVSHRKVVVRAPWQASASELQRFVSGNQPWIERRLFEESQRFRESLRIERGGTIFYRARELSLEFKEARKHRILVQGDRFIIQGHNLTPAKAKEQLQGFLVDKAQDYIVPRARGLARYLGVEQKITDIRLRKTKSKWGHCTSAGVLQYNWLIMLAPYSIIDYMISHEVCHLVYMDHSRRFWDLVESVCPDHKRYVAWLQAHEHRFWF